MLHATTMSVTGFHIVLQAHRGSHGLLYGRNELVAAFLGLELAYLVQVTNCTQDRIISASAAFLMHSF